MNLLEGKNLAFGKSKGLSLRPEVLVKAWKTLEVDFLHVNEVRVQSGVNPLI